jgi:hydroxyethylthiazole kinase
MTAISSALVLNIGTLTSEIIDAMILSTSVANEKKIPVILDVVGVGATKFRDDMAEKILDFVYIDIIKGNYSEIAKLAGEDTETKGVETTSKSSIVVMTGKEDIISDGKKIYIIRNGHEQMGSIVGTGCMAGSIIGVFASVNSNYCDASKDALCYFGVAGELAAEKSNGPGSFSVNLYDEVFNLSDEKVKNMMNFEERQG